MSRAAGVPRGLLVTCLVALFVVSAALVPVFLLSGGDGGTAAEEPLSPQELADAMTGSGAVGEGRGPSLSERLDPEERAPLPDDRLAAFAGGQAHAISDYAGSPLVVNFWASWCPPCVEEMPALDAVARRTEGELAILGVNRSDDLVAAEALVERLDVSYDLGVDEDDSLFPAVGAFGMPTTLFVDPEGMIVHRHTGGLTGEQFSELLSEHLGIEVPA
jgi:thiol-disulfide isomerase/thioredoxin